MDGGPKELDHYKKWIRAEVPNMLSKETYTICSTKGIEYARAVFSEMFKYRIRMFDMINYDKEIE